MAQLICNDGTKIEISQQTEAELRKTFGPSGKMQDWVNRNRREYHSALDPRFILMDNCRYLLISLPNANVKWTLSAWKFATDFIEEFDNDYRVYPIHDGVRAGFLELNCRKNIIIKVSQI